jgi:SagB-type dehydrogenase family enzyme
MYWKLLVLILVGGFVQLDAQETDTPKRLKLPKPALDGNISLEAAINHRRSIRSYQTAPLTIPEVGQLLWSAQGITGSQGFRAAPSAGALYPIEMFVVVGDVIGLSPGVYRYIPEGHKLHKILLEDVRIKIWKSSLRQEPLKSAPITLVFTVVYQRTLQKYGDRGHRYAHIEVGHAAQNVYLQCESLGLGGVVIGAFQDQEIREILGLSRTRHPLLIMPVGRRRSTSLN